ncbi:MAG: hypothetical protein H7A51_10305 [Akkermansiaceae bacterium]|nr:hypothetical protein [Akkermansiaceae bacterium]
MKTILTTLGVLASLGTALTAQSSFTYSFIEADGNPWPSDWSGGSFSSEGHHASGWGFDSAAPSDDYTGAYMGDQNVAVVGAKYYNSGSYSLEKGVLTYTMAWNVNGGKGFADNGSAGSPANQIFQMGLFNGTPTNTWFGKSLSNVSGGDSLYLAGVEVSANPVTQTGSLNLGVFDEEGNQLADFGSMNYTAVSNPGGGEGVHFFNFRQDYTFLNKTQLTLSLWMDEYVVNAGAGTTTYVGQTSFGTQTITHGLSSTEALTPGLGISVKDYANVSITAANYDGGVELIVVPEPGILTMLLAGVLPALGFRRRG